MKRIMITIAALAVILAACGESAGTADSPRKVEIDAKDSRLIQRRSISHQARQSNSLLRTAELSLTSFVS